MKSLLRPLLLCLMLGAPAWGASELEAVRGRAQGARTEVRTLRVRQQGLRDELNRLAAQIEALKAQRQGKLTAGAELEGALRRSQELSGELTGLAQAVAGAEGEAERANLALHAALSDELARARAAWDATPGREERARLLSHLRELRAERDAVRAALPPSRVPALERGETSDDPEDLLEQADALRDTQDKVRQRLAALKSRITEVRDERDLERRMSDFLGEDAMFDEQDRRMRLRLDASRRIAVDDSQRPSRTPAFGADEGASADSAVPPPAPASDSPPHSGPAMPGTGQVPTAPTTPPQTPSAPLPPIKVNPTARANDSRPQVDTLRAQQLAAGGPADLAAMEAEAERLERLAGELEARASSLERRVHELD